ncbi:methionyl aminopeptidase [Clostridium algidicarnis]|uniref:Methionine aminopeptidase n=2 Tax=Clostridium algidicarnis TaxID=37659 RepID=A0A2S6FWE2_9CLOT|nr:methionyl aminopeptidase [Clostridium algidicarnis]MBB6631067.1 methionyl aminopeptidase [Clostridium algidicarnis]MBB6698513.1 methionyl aminopeptidase [Clostridium algidicarnis]MBU3194286.1 methionyl aminopeptidase [Clostridium algidicarnis]MBU3203840.1 methionyl aminopeptidase [Clostridium algidicarnis]MBU3207428.1 methionyl aminopeptidase [Clostridium algidicarnis]
MSLDRNSKCWCGSGLKYKRCHLDFDERLSSLELEGYEVPTRDMIKNAKEIEAIKKSAAINDAILDLVAENIKEGMSTEEIDKLVYDYTISKGAVPAPLNFEGFPKSVCTSINEEVCHGIPSKDIILKNGDIINVDVSTIFNGYYSDASRMFMIGDVSDEARKLVKVSKECLEKGIEAVKPWGFLGDIGEAIQTHAENNGFSVVKDFGGHGVGIEFHEEPFVYHYGVKGQGMILVPGMMFTIEPMINAGDYKLFIDEDNDWTAITKDGSLSSQWENMILVTEDGIEIIAK